MEDQPNAGETPGGVDRRAVLRRGAVLGGALVWTVPAVQSIAGPAFAAGSPCLGVAQVRDISGNCQFRVIYNPTPQCCSCVATYAPGFGNNTAAAVAFCQLISQCTVTSTQPC